MQFQTKFAILYEKFAIQDGKSEFQVVTYPWPGA